jgi:transposase InsO family protein
MCSLRQARLAPSAPNRVWCMDFMHDRLMDAKRRPFRILTVVDIYTRECLALDVASGFRAQCVVEVLSRIVARRGAPTAIRCDQGTEFTAEALDQWAYNNRIELDFSRPGKPTDNAFIDSFNSSVRRELLNTSWFDTIEEARRAALYPVSAMVAHRARGTERKGACIARSSPRRRMQALLNVCIAERRDRASSRPNTGQEAQGR